MKKVYDFGVLMNCFKDRGDVVLRDEKGLPYAGRIVAVEMESGCGRSWNVTIQSPLGTRRTICVRTN